MNGIQEVNRTVHAERFAVRQSEADMKMRKGCEATERSKRSELVHAERFADRQSEADIRCERLGKAKRTKRSFDPDRLHQKSEIKYLGFLLLHFHGESKVYM